MLHRLSPFVVSPVIWTVALWLQPGNTSWASGPCVHFDVPATVAGYPLSAEPTMPVQTGDRLIEAVFDISTLIRAGRERDLVQVLFVIECPARNAQIVDYEPKTQLASDMAGNIGVKNSSETNRSIGANLSVVPTPIGTLGGNATYSTKQHSDYDYQLVPEMRVLSASGTIARGTAVYFKLKPSRQSSLDGSRRFSVIMSVPQEWRGDYLRVRCAAFNASKQASSEQHREPICGSSDFLVPVYLDGDTMARAAAIELVERERALRHLAESQQRAIEDQRYANVADRIGAMLNVSRPRIPNEWLWHVLRSEPDARQFGFERHLPPDVREAVEAFTESRWQLHQLSQPAIQPLDAIAG